MATKPTRKRPTRRTPTSTDQAPEVEWTKVIEHALTVPGHVGNTYSRFHTYSFLNTMLLMMQGATGPCASYKRWQAIGRQVRTGEKGLYINRPIQVKLRDKTPEGDDQFIKKFKMVKGAFQIGQTDGPDLVMPDLPEWDADLALAALTINVMPFLITDGNTAGYSQGRSFAINTVAPYPVKTRFHEIAHIVLGHTADDRHAEYVQHRGVFEFEAEATAFLVMKELDLLTDDEARESRGYIQGWLRGKHPGDAAIRRVFKAVTTILEAGRPVEVVQEAKDAA